MTKACSGVAPGGRLRPARRTPPAPCEKAGGDEEDGEAGPVVEAQREEVVGVVDAQRLDPGPADGVGGDVEGEQAPGGPGR